MGVLADAVTQGSAEPCGEIGIVTVPLTLLCALLLVTVVVSVTVLVLFPPALVLVRAVLAAGRTLRRRPGTPGTDVAGRPPLPGVAELVHLLGSGHDAGR